MVISWQLARDVASVSREIYWNCKNSKGRVGKWQRAVGKTYSFSEHEDLLILQMHNKSVGKSLNLELAGVA